MQAFRALQSSANKQIWRVSSRSLATTSARCAAPGQAPGGNNAPKKDTPGWEDQAQAQQEGKNPHSNAEREEDLAAKNPAKLKETDRPAGVKGGGEPAGSSTPPKNV